MNKKKLLTLALTLSMVAILAIGTTIAYFNEAETQTNVFTVGNLSIDLYEDAAHYEGTEKLKENTEPVTDKGKGADTQEGYEYKNIMPGDKMEKIVTVENTSDYPVYVTLAIKNNEYLNFNRKIDDYYENLIKNDQEELTKLLGENFVEDMNNADAVMQKITDAIWSGEGWGLRYTKPDPEKNLRYEMVNSKAFESDMYIGHGYANSTQGADGKAQWNYNGSYFDCQKGYQGDAMDGNFDSIPVSSKDHKRVWLIYLQIPAKESFDIDLSTTCPTFITTENIDAFNKMELDIQAAAIQCDGFENADAAFTELHEIWGFGY